MNTKIALGILSIVIIAGAYLLLSNTSTPKQVSVVPTPTQAIAPPSSRPTSEVKQASEVIIEVTDSGYSPDTITIKKGTKVIWISRTDRMVTVHSDSHPTHTLYPKLNLGSFITTKTVSVVLDEPGTYKYHNHLDASMTGTVIVE